MPKILEDLDAQIDAVGKAGDFKIHEFNRTHFEMLPDPSQTTDTDIIVWLVGKTKSKSSE